PTTAALHALIEKKNRQAFGLELRADALRIEFEPTDEFQRSRARDDHIIRTWGIRIQNIDVSHLITNCKLRGDFSGATDHLLNEIGTLSPGERRFIEVATHH